MDLNFSKQEEAFRAEVRSWLEEHLNGEFAHVKGTGGAGEQLAHFEERLEWEKFLGESGWSGIGWPKAYGGRGASLMEQVIFAEEYARAGGPGRLTHIGLELAAPTIMTFGTDEQKKRFLPKIRDAQELWCQGFSEPGAGSDLSNVRTKARLEGEKWVIEGQKIWTSHAQYSDWCFLLCRTQEGSKNHKGLSFLLVPMKQPGVEVRPIKQITGDAEFNEVFFDGARTRADLVVGEVGEGWKVAMTTLTFERGVSTLAQQAAFRNELDEIIAIARANGKAKDPLIRQRLAEAEMGLRIQRYNALRALTNAQSGTFSREGSITKIFWATWHRNLGKLAMDVMGPEAELIAQEPGYKLHRLQNLFLFSLSDTIYAGTNQIQRNIIAERVLQMPREPRGA